MKYSKRTGEYEPPPWDGSPTASPAPGEPPPAGRPGRAEPPGLQPVVSLASPQACRNCGIAKAGRQPVAPVGTERPRLLVLCGPPSVEAEQGRTPLAPEEMDYFLKWISAIELALEKDVLLMNFPRCRPPGNRPPFPEEMNLCAQIVRELVKKDPPQAILALGPVSSAYFTRSPGRPVSDLRQQTGQWQEIPLVVTYSPDQVLNDDQLKRPVWEDLKRLRNYLNGP